MNAFSPRGPSGKGGSAVIRSEAMPWWSNPRTALFVWILGASTTLVAGPLMFRAGESLPRVVVYNVSALVFLTTGFIAWRRRPGNPTGRQIMAIGFLETLPVIAIRSTVPWLVAIGHVMGGSGEVVLVYILLAYPWGRLSNRFDQWAVSVLAILFVLVGTVFVLSIGTCPYCPAGLGEAPRSQTTSVFQTVETLLYAITGAIVLVRIFRRYFVASRPARRVLAPVLFGGVVAILVTAWREVSPPLLGAHVPSPLAFSAAIAAEALIPIGLLLGFLRLRLERASIGALAADLILGAAVREQLQGVLAKRLGDPKLQVGFWSQDGATYVDRDGQVLELDRLSADRTVSMLDREGRPSVAIVFDAALAEDPGLFEQVGAVVRLAVGNITESLPSGRVTFLSTDIEKSTELLGRLGTRYGPVLSEHRQLLRRAVGRQNGYVVDSRADEFFAVFTEPMAAVFAAIDAQDHLAEEPWSHALGLKVRMGIHTGSPALLDGGYVGLDVHHAIRVGAVARGGQVLLSHEAKEALGNGIMDDLVIQPIGAQHLKGFPDPEPLYELVVPKSRA
ncbi:MAG: adenylate/guanylate cyclase domain-containing protein [Chloroflexi bacterium]|nr:MAG: adenylate/guanylate cyclase domain-containing protein [Chloroflexota bacterium]